VPRIPQDSTAPTKRAVRDRALPPACAAASLIPSTQAGKPRGAARNGCSATDNRGGAVSFAGDEAQRIPTPAKRLRVRVPARPTRRASIDSRAARVALYAPASIFIT